MSETTPLDQAHAAMEAAPEDGAARMRFYERLADGELFLMLSAEPKGDDVSPEIFELEEGTFVLAFDRESRLADFAGRPAPYVGLSGRTLAGMLAVEGLGLGVNLEVAPSSILIPPSGVAWLAETTANIPSEVEAKIAEVNAPKGLPESLISALDTKLATAMGLARTAYLVGVTYETGGHGHMLAFVDAADWGRDALARATGEALTFSGIEAGALDVGFFTSDEPMAEALLRAGLRFDLPEAMPPDDSRIAPGSDPDKPPILR